jgi:hypothetical protein
MRLALTARSSRIDRPNPSALAMLFSYGRDPADGLSRVDGLLAVIATGPPMVPPKERPAAVWRKSAPDAEDEERPLLIAIRARPEEMAQPNGCLTTWQGDDRRC